LKNTNLESEFTPLLKLPKHSGSLEISKEYQDTLNHLVLMASTQGWKDHAWYRAKELDADSTGIWRGIANDLVKTMKEINAKTKE
jgi:hypothetical protein